MFSHQQISPFHAFGFVVLPALLDKGETARLKAEVTNALFDAYGAVGADEDPDGTGGIRGDYLPLSVDRAPLSQALIADDPRLFQGSVALLGTPTVDVVDHDLLRDDAERWPTSEWAAGTCQVPSRRTALERLRLLGGVDEAR